MLKLILKKLAATMNVIRYTPSLLGFVDCKALSADGFASYVYPLLPTKHETTVENLTLPKPIPAGHRKAAVACASSIADIDMYFVPATKRDNKKLNRTKRGVKAGGTIRSVVKVGMPASPDFIYDIVEMTICPRCGNDAVYGQICACDYVEFLKTECDAEMVDHSLQLL